jgi:thioredoxin
MSNQSTPTKSIEVTSENFDALINSDTPTLVDFWAPWCGPCRALGPTIEQLAQDLDGKANIAKLNVDDNPSLAAKFGVSSIPTVLIFKNGQVLETLVGLRPANDYIESLGL